MKQNHLLRNIAAALLLCASAASCSQDDMPQTGGTPLPDGEYLLAFTASVDGMAPRSTGKDGWAEGDKIGVRIGADGATGCYELNHENGTVKEVHTPVYWQNTAPCHCHGMVSLRSADRQKHCQSIKRLRGDRLS